MFKLSIYISIVLFGLLFSCGSMVDENSFHSQPQNRSVFKDSLTLKEVGTFTLPLDSTIGFNNRSIYYFKGGNSGIISILNMLSQTVHLYEYKSRKLIKKIKLQKEGPNGVGSIKNASAHFMDCMDSLFILNYSEQAIYLLNGDGVFLRKYDLKEKTTPIPIASTVNKIVKVGNQLVIPCHPMTNIYTKDMKLPSLIILDLRSGEKKTILTYPETYNKGAWLGFYKFIVSPLYNRNDSTLLISFPVEPFIYRISTSGKIINKEYVGSKFTEKTLPYSSENDYSYQKNIATNKINEYLGASSSFGSFWFFPRENHYLREIWFSSEYNKSQNPETNNNRVAFIILDKNFNKKGEYELPMANKVYQTSISFVNEEGIHIGKIDEYKKNENSLTFGVFKIKQK